MKSSKIVKLFIVIVSFLLLMPIRAQVTIGSNETPVHGALLQIKNKANVTDDGENSTGGVGFPRVKLEQRNQLYPMYKGNTDYSTNKATIDKQLAGLTVYNTFQSGETETDDNLKFRKGLFVWTGVRWESVGISQVENGLNIDNQSVVRLGGSLTENTAIDMNGKTFEITTGAGKEVDIIGTLRTNQLYIDSLKATEGNSVTLVWNEITKKVEKSIGEVAIMTFAQSADETASEEIGSVTGTTTNNGNTKTVVLDWIVEDLQTSTGGDIVANNLTKYDLVEQAFALRDDANVEMSGYCGYIANNGKATNGTIIVNASIQVRKNIGTPNEPVYGGEWMDYTSVRGTYTSDVGYYRQTLNIPPAMYVGKKGDQIRMVVIIRPDKLGYQHLDPRIVIPWGTKFSKSLKLIQQ
ncbi:MAG: hypothetical protein ACK5L7_09380 [Paludibacteraceae bacterium]